MGAGCLASCVRGCAFLLGDEAKHRWNKTQGIITDAGPGSGCFRRTSADGVRSARSSLRSTLQVPHPPRLSWHRAAPRAATPPTQTPIAVTSAALAAPAAAPATAFAAPAVASTAEAQASTAGDAAFDAAGTDRTHLHCRAQQRSAFYTVGQGWRDVPARGQAERLEPGRVPR